MRRYVASITNLRSKEIGVVRLISAIKSINEGVSFAAPTLVAAATFVVSRFKHNCVSVAVCRVLESCFGIMLPPFRRRV
jgi:hypothetical protein